MWVTEEDLGKEITLDHNKKHYLVKVPEKINKEISLHLRGLGKKWGKNTGDLFLHVWLNKGEDIHKDIWLSDTSARNGIEKRLLLDGKAISMKIPPGSHDGLIIRLKGCGREGSFSPNAPVLYSKRRGDALVKLKVFPEKITPNYGSFAYLSTENMVLEGWVYRNFDEVSRKLDSSFPADGVQATKIADLFNEWGWYKIFATLVKHLKLSRLYIVVSSSWDITAPGMCEETTIVDNNIYAGKNYKITINQQFIDNPFTIAAILSHELCHVIYSEYIDGKHDAIGSVNKTEKDILEVERTVDLLVFMYKIGEFQLRVARENHLTIGYFNQEVFDRMQVIVTKKLNSIPK